MIFFALAAALAFSALHARTVGDFFVAATGDAVHALPQNKRAEMLAYLREAGRVVPAETEYGEEAAMLRATDNYLKVVITAADSSAIDNHIVSVRLSETLAGGEEMKGEIVK